ncbi:MAG: relaxase domain-containing protein [Deferribacteraceae bacterium]|jgi:conjugative relaxase-like TrwC/TraI family protein|nr:relaxase domain-containing protein [Deferribacteraceae bacterium]
MSLARPISASQAKDYYYQIDPISAPEGKAENSAWYGQDLIKEFSLGSRVDAASFTMLISGQDPRDTKEIVPAGVNEERRAGIDLAFSAPKSVSIAALHLGNEKVIEAHKAAVTKALEFVEQNLIQYRETKDGQTYQVKADNMLAATFLHTTSRSNDPQLHTHAVIINVVKTKDGSFKAISNEQIFKYQSLINNIYQNELAMNIQDLGYSIDNYKNKFEIAGISEEVREIFSKRQKEIEECYEQIKDNYPGLSEAEIRDIAVLQSRDDKTVGLKADKLRAIWETEAPAESIRPAMDGAKPPSERDLLKISLEQLQETEATFDKLKLLNTMIVQSRGEHNLEYLENVIEQAIQNKELIAMGEHKGHQYATAQLHYATPEMIRTEQRIVSIINQSVGTKRHFMKAVNVDKNITASVTAGQRAFIKQILTTEDFLTIIQGDAGTGKTFAVDQLRNIIETEKINTEIIGLGFTGKAAQELAQAAKINTATIASFMQSDKPLDGKLIIVDEASMVSSKDMLSLLERASKGNNRIALIGDRKQLQAIGAGKMFSELQRENVTKTTEMEEVLRQRTDVTKALVSHIKEYQDNKDTKGIKKAFELLESENLIREINSKTNDKDVTKLYLQEKAIEEYMASSDSVILTSSRAAKDSMNLKLRQRALTDEQRAGNVTVKVRENLSKCIFATEYNVGNKVSVNLKEYTVKEINSRDNTLTLEYRYKNSKRSKIETVNLYEKQVQAFKEFDKTFAPGEKIIFTQNDKKLGVQNGLSGTIEKIDNHGNFFVNLKDNKQVTFNINDYAHIDYGYALTLYKSQGQTCRKSILVHSPGESLNSEAFYVAATRATHEFTILTPDKESLRKGTEKAQDKTSTREWER